MKQLWAIGGSPANGASARSRPDVDCRDASSGASRDGIERSAVFERVVNSDSKLTAHEPRYTRAVRNTASLLLQRNFGLFFFGRCVSFLGNAMAPIALAFAVLQLTGSASALGLVLAARMVPNVALLVVGGVVADRLPRSTVLIGSNIVGGGAQAVAAILLLSGHAHIWQLVLLEALNGAAFAMFYPADSAVVPLTVAEDRLQEANALLRLGTNATLVLGAALAGVLVAAFNPGWAIAADAATFLVAAALMTQMRSIKAAAEGGSSFFRDLRDGWSEFIAHRWLWTIVAQFSLMLVGFLGAFLVLGPLVANRDLSGASSWAFIVGGQSAGLLAGGLVALRWHPERPLLVATIAVFGHALPIAALAMGLPLGAIICAAAISGLGMEVFGVYWYTALHEHVAREALSRVSAYDALGSIGLSPLGLVAAGPISELIGIDATLWLGVGFIVVPTAAVLLVPEVRTLRSRARVTQAIK
jgi:predicted MFS family arabinose efflux permease